ncbi:MAG: L-serine ammonia-lyase, iron-sulfur-dependent subunit beta [Butyricicoccus pullicaecorum]|nr:L-serine ammonia-lyase, iron-sulfur-dependent subunit beta [Butyricicoccus pullicaecorum]
MQIFDIIGPVMIGPSSSHTAGACRLGRVARKILADRPIKARIGLCGSFAQTYRGHGTDKALIAGILDMHTYDPRLRNALTLAESEGLEYEFYLTTLSGAHPNTAIIELTGKNGNTCHITGASIGGGNIIVTNINGLDVQFTGQYNTLIVLHKDTRGIFAAVTNTMAYSGANIGNFRLSRPQKGGEAVMTIEVDGDVSDSMINWLRELQHITGVVLVRAI